LFVCQKCSQNSGNEDLEFMLFEWFYQGGLYTILADGQRMKEKKTAISWQDERLRTSVVPNSRFAFCCCIYSYICMQKHKAILGMWMGPAYSWQIVGETEGQLLICCQLWVQTHVQV
jgi:hypothetical protein